MRHALIALALGALAAASPAQDLREQQRREEARKHYRAGEEYMLSEAFEKAAGEFKTATEMDPAFALAFYSLGQARMALKQYPGAVESYTSCRDLFLYVRDEALDEVHDKLTRAVGERGEVWRVDDLLREGFFGPAPSERLRKRLGNLVVLPYDGESAYWYEEGRFDMHYLGHHGGLTPAEMDTGAYLLPL